MSISAPAAPGGPRPGRPALADLAQHRVLVGGASRRGGSAARASARVAGRASTARSSSSSCLTSRRTTCASPAIASVASSPARLAAPISLAGRVLLRAQRPRRSGVSSRHARVELQHRVEPSPRRRGAPAPRAPPPGRGGSLEVEHARAPGGPLLGGARTGRRGPAALAARVARRRTRAIFWASSPTAMFCRHDRAGEAAVADREEHLFVVLLARC